MNEKFQLDQILPLLLCHLNFHETNQGELAIRLPHILTGFFQAVLINQGMLKYQTRYCKSVGRRAVEIELSTVIVVQVSAYCIEMYLASEIRLLIILLDNYVDF